MANKKIVNKVIEEIIESEEQAVVGIVTNCGSLNIRAKDNADADIVKTVPAGFDLNIDLKKSTKDWYKVNDFDGYCMKKFIEIK